MTEKISNIKASKHPHTKEINDIINVLEKFFNGILIALGSIGFLTAIIASTGLSEWASDHSGEVDVPVNFFGYFIELESDTFAGSPFAVFLYIIIIFTLISLVILCVKALIITNLKTKANMLNCLYRSEQFTELLVTTQCNSEAKDDEEGESL